MREKADAEVKACKGAKGWTKVTFWPDWDLFKIAGLDDDMMALLKKRVYDMAGTCQPKGLKVPLPPSPLVYRPPSSLLRPLTWESWVG